MDQRLERILESLEDYWRKIDFPLLPRLGPGVDVDSFASVNFDGVLPDELRVLYKWKNGIKPEFARDPIGRQTLFDGGILMTMPEVWRVQGLLGGDGDNGWSRSKIPIFESGGGEYYLLECDASSAAFGRIIFFDIGSVDFERTVGMYDSLGKLFQTVLKAYEDGLFRVGDHGYLEVSDYKELSRLKKEFNPGSDYWRLYPS
jgi:hypothetical protein